MSVYYEGNAFIDGGRIQNVLNTNSSISNCIITTSSLDMNLANITNVKDPINLQDAATKKYVDDLQIVYSNVSLNNTISSLISTAQSGTFIVKILSVSGTGPLATFNIIKGINTQEAQCNRTTSCPGISSTNVSLRITWPPNSGILLHKNGPDFNGNYLVKFM